MSLLLLSLAGAALYVIPLSGLQLPSALVLVALSAAAILAFAAVEVTARRLDARRLALLIAIAALDSALRLAVVTGVAGFSPVFLLILCSGCALGARFGFLAGALTLLLSGLITGGVGPWLPYEMLAAGWMGVAAAAVPRTWMGRRRIVALCAVALVSGFAYGAVTDLWDWAVFYRGVPEIGFTTGLGAGGAIVRFGRFYLATSATWDAVRAIGDTALVALLGAPILVALDRHRRRFATRVVPLGTLLAGDSREPAANLGHD